MNAPSQFAFLCDHQGVFYHRLGAGLVSGDVKGRHAGQSTITVSKNEMFKGFNEPEQFILTLVFVDGEATDGLYYVRTPFDREPGWNETSVNLDVGKLLGIAERPV